MEGKSKSNCKIRKRACSSSSSSSLVRRYRLKRAILVGKRTGSSTQVPSWNVGPKSPPLAATSAEIAKGKGGPHPLSVRKLGATLWEIKEVPSSPDKKGAALDKGGRRLSHSGSLLPRLSDPTNSPLPERMDQSGGGQHRRRASTSSQKLQITDYIAGSRHDYASTASVMELLQVEAPPRTNNHGVGGRVSDTKARLKDLGNSLTTTKELLKVLYRVGGFAKHHPSSISIISALKVELDQACLQVDELIHDRRSYDTEIEFLVRSFAEEKAGWRAKERDRVRSAVGHVAEELEMEKKLQRQTERLNKKLGKELADAKGALSKAGKEVESEKRAKEILQQVCDELARGIGEDRAHVEELKRESAKVIEEVEKEREMLQIADVLREERVQMKLSEAKYHFEEKNAAVESLRSELEGYLRSKLCDEENGSPNSERGKKLVDLLIDDGDVEDGSGESDPELRSIELNMDNATRSYKWSYGEEANLPRRSLSENIQWESISLKKGPVDSELRSNVSENLNGFDRERLLEFVSQALSKNNADETNKKPTKGLNDHQKAAGFGAVSLRPVASPIRKWGQPLSDPFGEDQENSLIVLPVNDLKTEGAEAIKIETVEQ